MALGHALQDVPEIGERLDVVELCRGDEGTNGGPSLSATIGAGEQMVLAPKRDGSDRAFDGIVVELDTAVVQEMTEGRPAGKGVTDRVGQTPAARNATELRLEPRLHCLDERLRFGITPAAAVFGGAPADRLFDRIELGDAAQGFGRDWRTNRLVHVQKFPVTPSKFPDMASAIPCSVA